jgi:hypothetical protein
MLHLPKPRPVWPRNSHTPMVNPYSSLSRRKEMKSTPTNQDEYSKVQQTNVKGAQDVRLGDQAVILR